MADIERWPFVVTPGSSSRYMRIVLETEEGVDGAVPAPGSYTRAFSAGPRHFRLKKMMGDDVTVSVEFGPTRTVEAGRVHISASSPLLRECKQVTIDADTLRERARDIKGVGAIWDALVEAAIPYLID